MDNKKLETFAASARRQLISEIGAKVNGVLAVNSAARIETPRLISNLEAAIEKHGGGDRGINRVIEEQAYSWFNRIIAFRFMDANRYTTIPVVSPEVGLVGQPAVLAAVKRGEFELEVFKNPVTKKRIEGLLNGSITSYAPQAEAYGLILKEYCRYWNKIMPFMFQREGDYTELLMPGDLLAQTSVLNQAVSVITVDDCKDVEIIGWLYQYYVAERKQIVFDSFKNGTKAAADELPVATQLFTPDWIVRYLVQNSVGRLWMLNHRESKLAEQMDYYIAPVNEVEEFIRIETPEELTVLDPACGSGHMLTYAFDLLYSIYEEEGYQPSQIPTHILENNLHGLEIDERAGALAAFALTMKARAKQRRFFSTIAAPRILVLKNVEFSAYELAQVSILQGRNSLLEALANMDQIGSLYRPDSSDKAILNVLASKIETEGDILSEALKEKLEAAITICETLDKRFEVVVANPPYMGSSNMNAWLSDWLKNNYPDEKSDLCTCFIERGFTFTKKNGYSAMITMQSWMFLSSYEKMRAKLLRNRTITSMVHLGTRAFDAIGGEVVSTTATVIANTASEIFGSYVRLTDLIGEEAKRKDLLEAIANPDCGWFYRRSSKDFSVIPGSPIVYWASEANLKAFKKGKPLGSLASPRVGLQTGENNKFIRLWWEVSTVEVCYNAVTKEEALDSKQKWFPYNKGGDFRKWYGNNDYLINWENDGFDIRNFKDGKGKLRSRPQNTDYYFKPSVSWSKISSGDIAFRHKPQGHIFDVAGTSLFTDRESDRFCLLGLMNSAPIFDIACKLSPTLNFEVGQIALYPVLDDPTKHGLIDGIVRNNVVLSKKDWDSFETSWDFKKHPLVGKICERTNTGESTGGDKDAIKILR